MAVDQTGDLAADSYLYRAQQRNDTNTKRGHCFLHRRGLPDGFGVGDFHVVPGRIAAGYSIAHGVAVEDFGAGIRRWLGGVEDRFGKST